MKEYGSSVQKLVDYIMTIDDEEKRTKYAFLMVELMKQIHPNMKDSTQDYSKKLWDDLFIPLAHTKALLHAHWRLNPPVFPVTSTTSHMK